MPVALYCEPDAYLVEDRQMVGRRAVGTAFLRAAVQGRGNDPFIVYGGSKQGAEKIANAVKGIDSNAPAQWIPSGRMDMLERVGTMFRPDPALGANARLRLRRGVTSYSLCGITHTLSSARAQEVITGYANEPLMPWDAVICTSTAALGIVQSLVETTLDYHRWRWGADRLPPMPQFPVIPLGVHAHDFNGTASARQAARTNLGLAEDEIAILFAGRLSYSTKAHPYPMYHALSRVTEQTGRRLVLVQAGQFFAEASESAIRKAADLFCPGVRQLYVDGADARNYAAAFQGADLFMSLSENIQETFGITPVEAMASGIPVIVTDWNGYRDTVRDGIDGFRIATWAPQAGSGGDLAQRLEIGELYEMHCARTAGSVALDMRQLIDRLTALVVDSDLRRTMGAAGRKHVQQSYDWSVIYRQYQHLWAELGDRRKRAAADGSATTTKASPPSSHPSHSDVYRVFSHYPTNPITPDTIVRMVPGADADECTRMANEPTFQHLRLPLEQAIRLLPELLQPKPLSALAEATEIEMTALILLVGQLAKMNIVALETAAG